MEVKTLVCEVGVKHPLTGNQAHILVEMAGEVETNLGKGKRSRSRPPWNL